MFIKIVARVRCTTEDTLLQDLPTLDLDWVWRTKYIHLADINSFEKLERGKTIIYYGDGYEIIRENVNDFAARLEELEIKMRSLEEEEIVLDEEDLVLGEDDEEETEQ